MISTETKLIIMRGGFEHKKFGDPYEFCLSVFVTGDEAKIFALAGIFNIKYAAEIRKHLLEMGIKTVTWERRKQNRTKIVSMDIANMKNNC